MGFKEQKIEVNDEVSWRVEYYGTVVAENSDSYTVELPDGRVTLVLKKNIDRVKYAEGS